MGVARLSSKDDARLTAMARSKRPGQGVRAAEERALDLEAQAGIEPWHATPMGLVGIDSRHLLLAGERSYEGVLAGAAMYDPITDEAVFVIPQGEEIMIEIGPLLLLDHLGDGKHRFQRQALEHLIETYADGLGEVGASNWLVGAVVRSAATKAEKYGIDVLSYRGLLPRDAAAVWKELEANSVAQPWGRLGRTNPAGPVVPRRRFIRL